MRLPRFPRRRPSCLLRQGKIRRWQPTCVIPEWTPLPGDPLGAVSVRSVHQECLVDGSRRRRRSTTVDMTAAAVLGSSPGVAVLIAAWRDGLIPLP